MPSSPAYSFGIRAYGLAMRLAALWRNDARKWLEVRQRPEHRFRRVLEALPSPGQSPRIWLHCASLGEYEQGLPVLKALEAALAAETGKPVQGIISFFSPSGLEEVARRKQAYPLVYLPLDTPTQAEAFAQALQADIGMVVKYEFWLNHLHALRAAGTRLHLVSAHFRPDQVFFGASWKPWTRWFLDGLRCFAGIHCQNNASMHLLDSVLGNAAVVHQATHSGQSVRPHVQTAGDTRMDRVLERAAMGRAHPLLEAFARRGPVCIAGSTWLPDDALLGELVETVLVPHGWRLIVAPHHVDAAHTSKAMANYPAGCARFSELEEAQETGRAFDWEACSVLLVDRIGLLADAYRLGQLAYIGGGFGEGIHNTLEAAVFGLPMAFGPRWQKFAEARDLIQCGAAHSIADAGTLASWAKAMLSEPKLEGQAALEANATARFSGTPSYGLDRQNGDAGPLSPQGRQAAKSARAYVDRHAGASTRICSAILADWKGHPAPSPSAKV